MALAILFNNLWCAEREIALPASQIRPRAIKRINPHSNAVAVLKMVMYFSNHSNLAVITDTVPLAHNYNALV